jgi:hypothetical protein
MWKRLTKPCSFQRRKRRWRMLPSRTKLWVSARVEKIYKNHQLEHQDGDFLFFSILFLKLQKKWKRFSLKLEEKFRSSIDCPLLGGSFHFPPWLVELWIETKKHIRILFPLFTGDHCLDKIGFIDHFIMDTLDKPAKKNKKVKQNRNEDFK